VLVLPVFKPRRWVPLTKDPDDDGDDDDDGGDGGGDAPPEAGVEQLKRYGGPFELPKRFDPLYGCERRLTLKGRSNTEELLAKIQALLLVVRARVRTV